MFYRSERKHFEATLKSDCVLEVNSTSRLALYELRTLKRAFTFEYKHLADDDLLVENAARLVLDFKLVEAQLNKFNADHCELHEPDKTQNKSPSGFELLIVDIKGNVYKANYYFR